MNRFLIYLVILGVLLAVFLSTYYAKDSYELLPVNTTLNENPEPLDKSWFQYESPKGEFTVSMPLLPQTATQDIQDPKTAEVRHYEMYVAQTDDGTIYMISLITLPNQPDQDTLTKIMSDMVSANKGNKLNSSKIGLYQGMPSLDFSIDKDQHFIEAREFINGNTVYLLSTISKAEYKNKSHFNYFINSFKFKKGN